ncbi:glycosyltransferase family 4 protein [Cellulomonas sp. 179-A 4D5 NHS]|uniref:glycosyltransferase family 4 protein n=1 Tax=Cellulomonas sp. 179-A 4D5 NHS TaxID=3142378 RepID=UPI0039A255D1
MTAPLLLVGHPSPDLYGSDRQLLETVSAAVGSGWRVEVVLPLDGPLVELLEERGAGVRVVEFPVLRKALLRPRQLVRLPWRMLAATLRLRRLARRLDPALVYVNTVTIPEWIVAGRLAGRPVACHVHETDDGYPRIARRALTAPLLLARSVIANSGASRHAVTEVVPRLDASVVVVHNGVPGPPDGPTPLRPRVAGDPAKIALVGRMSPRKGTHVALEATARLVAAGHDVSLRVCGTVFPGYEFFEEELRERAARPDLAGRVTLAGYVHPTWGELAAADVVLVPSRSESFGNTAVEAMLAGRPVVASGVQGLAEVLDDGRTGLLVPPDDPAALADAIASLLDDPAKAVALAAAGLDEASRRFTVTCYTEAILRALADASGGAVPEPQATTR